MHINGEAILATGYLEKEGRKKNRCFLSADSLFIMHKGVQTAFSLDDIKAISFKHKLLLLPLIVGGIITPFSILAIFRIESFNPWFLLCTMVFGLLMMYYGYEGSPTLSVLTSVKEYDYFISKPSNNLKLFVRYAQQIQLFGENGKLFYFNVKQSDWQVIKQKDYFKPDKPIKLKYYQDIKGKRIEMDEVLLAFDPTLDEGLFKLEEIERNGRKKLVPILDSRISINNLQEVQG